MFFQVHGHLVRLVYFGMLVPVPPLFMQAIHQLQGPFKVFTGRAAPYRHGMIFMRHLVYRRVLTSLQYMESRTKHLNGFQQDFTYVLVHHAFGNFLLNQRKNKEIHFLQMIDVGAFQFLFLSCTLFSFDCVYVNDGSISSITDH